MTKESNSAEARPGFFRRLFRGIWITAKWAVGVLIAWWLLAAIIPGLPRPLEAAKSLFSVAKDVSDDIYTAARREDLEQAAKQVLQSAEQTDRRFDTMTADEDRLPQARRKLLPSIPLKEDSSLRSEMKEISKTNFIGGRVINILLVGIDSRLGVRDARADALHLFTINPDSAVVEIMSIPRDSYCDLGYPDTTSFNIIANARAGGMRSFLRHIEELTNRGPIKYYGEVGFSQALGVLEILGYRDPVNTLKFLRTRKALPGGDIQRSHNQALFLRSNLISKFDLLTGATGDLFLTAGLRFITSNMSKDFCQGLIYMLDQKGFPKHRPDAVRLRMLPRFKIRLKEMVADSLTIARTLERTDRVLGEETSASVDVANRLRKVNRLALADSARPGQVINRLRRFSEQHAWLQIRDQKARTGIRDTMLTCLERAYRRVGKTAEADDVLSQRKAEELLLPVDH